MRLETCMVMAAMIVAVGVLLTRPAPEATDTETTVGSPFLTSARDLRSYVSDMQRKWDTSFGAMVADCRVDGERRLPDRWRLERETSHRQSVERMEARHRRIMLEARTAADLARWRLQYGQPVDEPKNDLANQCQLLERKLVALQSRVAEWRRHRSKLGSSIRSDRREPRSASSSPTLDRFNIHMRSGEYRRWDFADNAPWVVARLVAYNPMTQVLTLEQYGVAKTMRVRLDELCSADRLHVRLALALMKAPGKE